MDDLEIAKLDNLESSHWWYIIRRRILSSWVSGLPKGSRVLDLGSATGANTLLMQSRGLEVTSLEYSDLGVSIQIEKGIRVVKGDARNLPFKDSEFDACICLDVLEHIHDDREVMREIKRVTKSSGRVLISVPEDPTFWSNHDVAVGHVRRYSRENLESLAKELEFAILMSKSQNWILKPIVRIVRRRLKGSQLDQVNFILNSLLYAISRVEIILNQKRFAGMTLWTELQVSK